MGVVEGDVQVKGGSGVYFVRFEAGAVSATERVMLVK